MLKNIKFYITILVVLICAVFSFGLIKANEKVSAGGIFVGENGHVDVTGGLFDSDDKAIVITGGEHTLRNMTITGSTNSAIQVLGGAVVTIENSTITDNIVSGNGGAIYVGENSTLIIRDCEIYENRATGNGGAIFADKGARVQISGNTVITGNTASIGGGIYLEEGALLNNGTSGLEFFSANISTSDNNIWQNVYYYEMDINFELEGIINSEKIYNSIENIKTSEVPDIDFSSYLDYYTLLPYANASDSQISNMNYVNAMCLNLRPELEGKSGLQHYGENKIKYSKVSSGYQIQAARKIISGKLVLQSSYNNLPVVQVITNGFKNCKNITGSLIIPNSVKTIGGFAFQGCSKLTGDLTIPDSVTTISSYAFYGCNGLAGTLTIGNSVKTIATYAFANLTGFTGNLIIPDSVETIEVDAFLNCSGLNGLLTLGNGIYTIGARTFSGCNFNGKLMVPSSVVYIGEAAFSGCFINGNIEVDSGNSNYYSDGRDMLIRNDGLVIAGCNNSNITGMEGISGIGEFAFNKCSGLKGDLRTTSQTVKTIGGYAFSGCSGLTSIELPGVITISRYAFRNCTGLKGLLYIPESLVTIGEYAFYNCSGFSSIEFDLNSYLTTIGNAAFYGCSRLTTIDTEDNTLKIPSRVNRIGSSAFMGCSGLETANLYIPQSVTYIGEIAFAGCFIEGYIWVENSNYFYSYGDALISSDGVLIAGTNHTVIPSGVRRIGEYAFYMCSQVLHISEEVVEIGKFAFFNFEGHIYFEESGSWAADQNGNIVQINIQVGQDYIAYFKSYYYRYWYKL